MAYRITPLAALLLLSATPCGGAEFHVRDTSGNAVANAVVTIDGHHDIDGQGQMSVIEQRQQQFDPRITVIRKNSAVRFPNRDMTLHHVYSFSEARAFELQLYAGDDADPVVFDTTGIIALGCNIHDWMLGYIIVTDHASFGISDEHGKVAIDDIATDARELSVWHAALLSPTPVTVPFDKDLSTITIELSKSDPLAFEIDPLQSLFEDDTE